MYRLEAYLNLIGLVWASDEVSENKQSKVNQGKPFGIIRNGAIWSKPFRTIRNRDADYESGAKLEIGICTWILRVSDSVTLRDALVSPSISTSKIDLNQFWLEIAHKLN